MEIKTEAERRSYNMRLIDADALRMKAQHAKDIAKWDGELLVVGLGHVINAPTIKSPRPDWTPCAEGLPEENGTYLVFAPSYCGGSSSGLDVINGIMFSRFKSGKWSIEHGYYNRPNCVIAWQPLPELYNPDRKEAAKSDDVSQWPDWKQRAALSNYDFKKEDSE